MKIGERCKISSIDGCVIPDVYIVRSVPNHKGVLEVEDNDGNPVKVHKDRLLRPDTPTTKSKRTFSMSEDATTDVVNQEVSTSCNGDQCDNNCDQKSSIGDLATPSNLPGIKESIGTDRRAIHIIDLEYVAGFGSELWEQSRVNFDHTNIDVKSYVLLAENPDRKLCFVTYDGSLGKKSNGIERLNLDNFKNNTTADNGKIPGHQLKHSTDVERSKLANKGYVKIIPAE